MSNNNINDDHHGPITTILPEVEQLLAGFRSSQIVQRRNSPTESSPSVDPSLPDALDRDGPRPNHEDMNAPTREEIDAKLQVIETRMDGRVASIESKIDHLVESMNSRMQRIEQDVGSTNQYVRTLKHTIIGTAIAVVLGVAGLNYTLLSNMLSAFESGKNTASSQAEVKRQTEETAALLKQIQAQINNPRAPQAPAPAQPPTK